MCHFFFVSSTGRQARSLVVDSTRGASFRAFIPTIQDAFLFFQYNDLPLSYSHSLTQHTLSLLLSLSSFLRYLCMSPESKKFTLEGVFSNSFSRTSLSPVSPRSPFSFERRPEVERGLEIYAPQIFRSSFALRSYESRSSLERMVRIVISRLDISTRTPAERKATLLSENLSVASIRRFSFRGIPETFHARVHASTNRSHSRKISSLRNIAMTFAIHSRFSFLQ